jgi:hypothetical protein
LAAIPAPKSIDMINMKKAQLQIMENAFILLIIFIILVFAFIFVINMQQSGQRQKVQEFNELELIKKSRVLNFMPELQCSDNNNFKPDCYDMYKIESFKKEVQNNKLFYESLLGKINLTIMRYDPDADEWTGQWTVYDNPKADFKGIRRAQFFVILYNATEKLYYLGVVYLGVYE